MKLTNYEVNLLKFHSVLIHFPFDFYFLSWCPFEEITQTTLNDAITPFTEMLFILVCVKFPNFLNHVLDIRGIPWLY